MQKFILSATFAYNNENKWKITENVYENEAKVNLGEADKLTFEDLENFAINLPKKANRPYTINLDSFVTKNLDIKEIIKCFSYALNYGQFKTFSLKTEKQEQLIFEHQIYAKKLSNYEDIINKQKTIAEAVNNARYYQALSPNIANSETLAKMIPQHFENLKNVKVSVLNERDIHSLGMNLMLSVNKGSLFLPRMIIIEYTPNPLDTNKTVLVGKGITYDSGGYSLKSPKSLVGMKYDMTGSVVAGFSLEAIAKLNANKNFAAVLMLTDNRINGDASLPDNIYKSMNGKTVEINNTDAEGRLVLADGITYAIRNLKATRLIDIATLTGAIFKALGDTYVGTFATSDQFFDEFKQASALANEKIWRMPMDEEYAKNIKSSQVADLKNADLSGLGGSISAAMFLNEFRENTDLIHLDIAGVAKKDNHSTITMIRTLVELALNEQGQIEN
ncbi:M17 family metallopeptidase [Mycoplasma miroungirhinis]|uniref:Probable cytosol aminopeptidase n=1 Tax=Mycoplasma miroungirhinis TaxID=754516 RepID=A0A6M4JE92_9MOLU|nr:leucyl aminopeptidase family protein [Mycoplasma miroungirhinis]QJR44396.1 leucyl aminopeptidase family protein [Mycoplasma miroungirhinis]